MKINLQKPEPRDLQAAWRFLKTVYLAFYGFNPLKPLDEAGEEYAALEDEDAAEVLAAITAGYEDSGLEWLLPVLETLLSPAAGIIDQTAETLTLLTHPDTARLDWLQNHLADLCCYPAQNAGESWFWACSNSGGHSRAADVRTAVDAAMRGEYA